MATAVIVDAVRTPGGRRNGKLSGWHPADLAGEVLKQLVERNQLDPALIDDVIMGCVMQVGSQGLNIGRNAVLAAGFPESVPATSVDRQCGSSQQAAHFAAQGVIAGAYDIAIAAGVEVMTTTPMGASITPGSIPFGPGVMARYADQGGLVPQGISAEMIADKWEIPRSELDELGLRSHQLAHQATEEGRFEREIVPFAVNGDTFHVDQGIRPESTLEKLSSLKPAFKEDGRVTAGNSSQISDGAAAVLLMERSKAEALGLKPRARILDQTTVGVDPVIMLTGPIPATKKLLERNGMIMDDIDLVEINEAFASVIAAWRRELEPDMDRVNVNGGAIALGHPLGSTGARLITSLLHEMERTDKEIGLVTMCCGGGLGTGTILQRI